MPEAVIDPAGHGSRVWFRQVPEGGRQEPVALRPEGAGGVTSHWTSAHSGSRLVERLIEADRTVLRIKDEPNTGLYAAAMQDPEGNGFDVV
ncbi:VOC family protein [Streptomyces albidochromogenes]|uniref:VOC family protein n=1 Tax=Streptomyces albidochromogenes TaxID=329524 RepID=A0ABW6FDJ1_9ACTN